jgi:hypothetical protein
MTPRHEYRIRYGRRGWQYDQSRIRQSASAARRLAKKLAAADDTACGPITHVTIDRRTVGDWEPVEEL